MAAWLGTLPVSAGDLIFAGYNLENYAPVFIPGEVDKAGKPKLKPGKTAEAAACVVQLIKEISPDVLGVCEMGGGPQFEEFRKRLSDAGLGYTDFEYVDGPDPDRRLALASRFPIVARQSLVDVSYESDGAWEKVRRGFLDVTIRVNGQLVRLVGAHLKSKLPGAGNEEAMRRNEAHLLRNHVSEILAADPGANLLVYGDFNDTKDQPCIQEVAGRRGSPEALSELALADSQGDRWTQYWNVEDVYSRIDYLFVNRALSPRVVSARCYVYRSPVWNEASDHRPVVATLHFPDQ
jgi:endonuclease/exonuclease/phosphatase family metal-dependent hydrolase